MIETTLLSAFLFTFGIQVGGILRDRQYWRSVGSQVKEQVASPWYGPATLAARIHTDQDCVPDFDPVSDTQQQVAALLSEGTMTLTCEHCGAPTAGRADSISLWGMYDDHTFKPYTASSVDDLIAAWRNDLREDDSGIALCPIVVKSGTHELRRVGSMLHPDYDRGVPRDEAAVAIFRETVLADPDISRLMNCVAVGK